MNLYYISYKHPTGNDHHTYIFSLPEDYYGNSGAGYTGYYANPASYWSNKDNNNNANSFWFTVQETFSSGDSLQGGNAGGSLDVFYSGLGDDTIDGRDGNDRLVGGGGDDSLTGGGNGDTIYGDWANVVQMIGGGAPPTDEDSTATSDWELVPFDPYDSNGDFVTYGNGDPAHDRRNQDLSIVGDDIIFGGEGSDTIVAGPGNDQIDAGPHGQSNPYTDDVSGGSGSDAFLLSYDSSSPGADYWSASNVDETLVDAAAGGTKAAIIAIGKGGAASTLGAAGSSILFSAAGAAGGELVSLGLNYLLGMDKTQEPKNNQDVMIVRDFNPAEDSLFLPIDLNKKTSLTVEPVYVQSSASGTVDLEGYALNFSATSAGTLNYAQIYLDEENYLAAFNDIAPLSQDDIKQLLSNVLLTATNISPDGFDDSTTADPFGDYDPEPPDFEATSGTFVQVLGAYGPVSIVDPGGTGNGIVVGGTQHGDVITVNDVLFLPEDYETYRNEGKTSESRSLIVGFAGDDVLYGGSASDVIHGGDGDDLIYSFDASQTAGGDIRENLFGGDGDDHIFGGDGSQLLDGGAGSDRLDGKNGTDTVSYADSATAVTVDLASGFAYEDTTSRVVGEWRRVEVESYGTSFGMSTMEVDFRHDYADPIVILGPLQYQNPDLATARVVDVLEDSFVLSAPIYNRSDTRLEYVTYMVVEKGQWTLEDGTLLEADTFVTDNTLGTSTPTQTVGFGQYFDNTDAPPAVFSSVQTNNAAADDSVSFVGTRNLDADGSTVEIGLEVPGNVDSYGANEIIAYLAVQSSADDGIVSFDGGTFDVGTSAALYDTEGETLTLDVGGDSQTNFLANLATDNGSTPVFLRYGWPGEVREVELYTQIGTAGTSSATHPEEAVSFLGMYPNGGAMSGVPTPDRLFNIENILGSSLDDRLVGSSGANVIEGGAGGDSIDGGDGADTASYAGSASGVSVDLAAGAAAGGDAEGDTLVGIENITGTDHADSLSGDAENNRLESGSAADNAPDTMAGGAGNDIFVATAGGDLVTDFAAGDVIDLSVYFPESTSFSSLQDGFTETMQADGSLKTVIALKTSTDPQGMMTVITPDGSSLSESDFVLASPDGAIQGTDGQDHLAAGEGDDALFGLRGDDTLVGGRGDDKIVGGGGADRITLGAGADIVEDLLLAFDGDILADLSSEDSLRFVRSALKRDHLTLEPNEGNRAVLSVDHDQDGQVEAALTLLGDFSNGDVLVTMDGLASVASFLPYLPTLRGGRAVDPSDVNGTPARHFLTGDGKTDFQLALRNVGYAGYDSALGVYEIDEDGAIRDARLLIADANADKTAQVGITNVEDGHMLGFFIVQDAARWAEGLDGSETLEFLDGKGETATFAGGADVALAVDGSLSNQTIFHSAAASLNVDGLEHALSGIDPGAKSMTIGFEDLTGGGDVDYEDVVFSVSRVAHDDFWLA